MKLWLLSRPGGGSWGMLNGAVVRAETEEEARDLTMRADSAFRFQHSQKYTDVSLWLDPTHTSCERLIEDGEAGVVLADVEEP